MKRLAAILLIAVLFFNWYGYRLMTGYLQQCADKRLETRLDNNDYDESLLVPVKTQVTALTYYEEADEWERTDGEITLNGIAYKYVKHRIHNDSIELLCIPNTAAIQLSESDNAFFRLVNNLVHLPGQKTAGNTDIQKVYTPSRLLFLTTVFLTDEQLAVLHRTAPLAAGFILRMERPPAFLSFFC